MLSVLSLPAFSFSAGAEEAPAAAEASTGEPDAGPEKENDGAEPEAAEARALPRKLATRRRSAVQSSRSSLKSFCRPRSVCGSIRRA